MSLTEQQRRLVRSRARNCCEYCRVTESGRLSKFHIDHIIAQKHGGTDDNDNLCLACYKCNAYKGSNIAAIDPETDEATKLFHPRRQIWEQHFEIKDSGIIQGLTPEGRTTINVLNINAMDRIKPRYLAMQVGDYPC